MQIVTLCRLTCHRVAVQAPWMLDHLRSFGEQGHRTRVHVAYVCEGSDGPEQSGLIRHVSRHRIPKAPRKTAERSDQVVHARFHLPVPSGLQLAGIDRQGADAFSRGSENRVSDRWRHAGAGCFAESTGSLHALDNVSLYGWGFVHSHRSVVVKITLLHAPALERNGAV